jgi:hypothetical protein
MSKDIASQIEKEYGTIEFKHPAIDFGYNKIEIRSRFNVYNWIFLLLTFVPVIIVALVIDFPLFSFFILIPVITLFSLFYKLHRYFDTVSIDFLNKELTIINKIGLINMVRRWLKIKTEIPFIDIAYFTTDDGKRNYMMIPLPEISLIRGMRKTSLYVKPKFTSAKLLASFQFEREARRLGELLQFYVVGKPGIIE